MTVFFHACFYLGLQETSKSWYHRWIHKIIIEIGRNHDEELLQYVQHLESVLQTEQVIFGTL